MKPRCDWCQKETGNLTPYRVGKVNLNVCVGKCYAMLTTRAQERLEKDGRYRFDFGMNKESEE